MGGLKDFLNKHLVLVVMIPSIVGLHWGWYQLQHNETFVKKEDQIDGLPIFHIAHRIRNKLLGTSEKPTE